jgi:tetratricopeptide (TPR) repeat protein
MQYKGIQKPIQEIARALNVDAIVEGSYFRAGKQVRITAQLLDARNDRYLWAQTYDESDKDLLAMQDQVTNDIVQQVAIALGSGFTRSKLRSVNPRSRDAYLRGRHFWNERTLPALTNSVKYYTAAIREDPDYADAYAALAEAYVLLSIYGGPDPSIPLWKARYAAERALYLDSSLGEAHTALGAVKTDLDWDWSGAEKEYQRALQLNPDDPTAHHWYSLHLSRLGRTREAETEIQRALALDPLSPIISTDAAETAYWARNPNEARARIEMVLAMNPDFAEAHVVKGKILEQLHLYNEAEAEFQTAEGLFGGGTNVEALQAHAMALKGEREEALKAVHDLESQSPNTYVSGVDIGEVYCGLHQTDDAMKWLNRAYQRRDKGIDIVGIDPLFDGCRSDPAFNDLLNRLKLIPG